MPAAIDNIYKSYLKKHYEFIDDDDIVVLEKYAISLLYNLRYPVGDDRPDFESFVVPKQYESWVVRCMEEIIQRQGISSSVSYAENGLKMDFDRANLSYGLINEITGFIGVFPRKENGQ